MEAKNSLSLREFFEEKFTELHDDLKDVKRKIDYILHPTDGIYAELHKINAKADAAHRRLDQIDDKTSRRKQMRDKILSAVAGGVIMYVLTKALEVLL